MSVVMYATRPRRSSFPCCNCQNGLRLGCALSSGVSRSSILARWIEGRGSDRCRTSRDLVVRSSRNAVLDHLPTWWHRRLVPKTWSGHWSAPRVWFHWHDRSLPASCSRWITWYVAMAGSDQMAIQRYLATRDVKAARRALGIAWSVEACAFFLMAHDRARRSSHGSPFIRNGSSRARASVRLPTAFSRFIVNGLRSG